MKKLFFFVAFIFAMMPAILFTACDPDDSIMPEPEPTPETDTIPQPIDTLFLQDTAKPVVVPKMYNLTYHKVVAADSLVKYTTQVSVQKLESDFKWLTDNGYTAILPRDLLTIDTVQPKTVIITFDDGYYDNYLYMYPLLEKYGLKAEINVIT